MWRITRIPLRPIIDTLRDVMRETMDRVDMQGHAMTQLDDAAHDAVDALVPEEREPEERLEARVINGEG